MNDHISNPDNNQRRDLARIEMENYSDSGLFRYLLRSPHIRHVIQPDGLTQHSIVDVLNIIYNVKHDDAKSDFNPHIVWRNLKNRLKKDDIQLCQKIAQLKIPSWTDGKSYDTDMIDTGWLFFLITGLRSPISNLIRAAFADELNQYDRQHHAAIIGELDREVGWAGTRNRLLMASVYEVGDYDDPVTPPGCPE